MLTKTLCLILALVVTIEAKCERNKPSNVKTYIIDLDQAPRDRFKEVSMDFKQPILDWINAEKSTIDFKYLPLVEEVAAKIDDYLPYPFNEEMKGIADVLNVTVGDVVLFNLIYDVTAFCTGILTVDSNGQILHGRNLDYALSSNLQALTYRAKFYKNNTLVYTSAQTAGFLGILSGHKHKQFTFEINERDQGEWWINALYLILDRKATPLSFLTRYLMENMTSYDDAVNLMSKSDLIAPAYFIIGGTKSNEATILTRNQSHLIDAWTLNSKSTSFDNWFLIQTNYDHWTQPPADDDRRDPGIKAMTTTTQANISYDTLMDVMSINPVCNNKTVYSVVMSALDDSDDGGLKILVH